MSAMTSPYIAACASGSPPAGKNWPDKLMKKLFYQLYEADVILVSGGNTLFAVDRWQRAAMVEPLRRAMARGATPMLWLNAQHRPPTVRSSCATSASQKGRRREHVVAEHGEAKAAARA